MPPSSTAFVYSFLVLAVIEASVQTLAKVQMSVLSTILFSLLRWRVPRCIKPGHPNLPARRLRGAWRWPWPVPPLWGPGASHRPYFARAQRLCHSPAGNVDLCSCYSQGQQVAGLRYWEVNRTAKRTESSLVAADANVSALGLLRFIQAKLEAADWEAWELSGWWKSTYFTRPRGV